MGERLFIFLAVLAGVLCCGSFNCDAATATWTNSSASGYWTNDLNWNPATAYPGKISGGDSAFLTNNVATYTNVLDATLGNALATLAISNSTGEAWLIVTNATLISTTLALGTNGRLRIDAGGVVTDLATLTLRGTNGLLAINSGGRLYSDGLITVGLTGGGQHRLLATNANLTSAGLSVGNGSSSNTVSILANTAWDVRGGLIVGSGASTSNALIIHGGILSNVGTWVVGGTASNLLRISGGGALISTSTVNNIVLGGTLNKIVITDPGSTLTNSGSLTVQGNLSDFTMANGATGYVAQLMFVEGSGSGARITLTDTNTLLTVAGGLQMGRTVNNVLIVSNGARLVTSGVAGNPFSVGAGTGSNNTMIVTGPGSQVNVSGAGWISGVRYSGAIGGSNTLIITDGGRATFSGAFNIGGNSSSNNVLLVSAGGQLVAGSMAVGSITFGGGNLVQVTGTGSVVNVGALAIGGGISNSHNRVRVEFGGSLTSGTVIVGGSLSAALGTNNNYNSYEVDNASAVNGAIAIGNHRLNGFNSALFTNARVASSGAVIVGNNGSSNNTITVSGTTTWDVGGNALTVGNSGGTGNVLTVQAGSSLTGVTKLVVGVGAAADNNSVLIHGGLLEANVLSNSIAGGTGNTISNVAGTFQFTTNTPVISPGGFGNIALTDGTISYRAITNADVTSSLGAGALSPISFAGNNTFMLNAASNTLVGQSYTFQTGNPSNYAALVLINGATAYRGGNITVGATGTMLVSNTTATVAGVLTNSGSLSFVNARATFQSRVYNSGTNSMFNSVGTFTAGVINAGRWATDPTTNIFQGFGYTNTASGVITMTAGDVYVFTNTVAGAPANFVNVSTNKTASDTTAGKFLFSGGLSLTQTFYAAGQDLGGPAATATNQVQTPSGHPGFTANFALGTLEISNFSTVRVSDAFSVLGPGANDGLLAGLYLENLFLGADSLLIIDPGVQVYFKNSNNWSAANFLLEGNPTYDNSISGLHQLVVVPEPSTLLLLLTGTGVLWWRRRKN